MIVLSIIGILGGKWLWKALASSDLFKTGIPIYIKIIGCIALVVFLIFIGFGFFLFYSTETDLIRVIIQQGTLLMLFVALYNIGYLISIWFASEKKNQNENLKFQIKWKLSITVIILLILYVFSCFVILLLITGEYLSILFQYMILGGIGIGIGWLFWEHLKEAKILSGKLLKDLKFVSIIFEIPVIIIMILGIISNYLHDVILDKIILLSFLLLFYLISAYFIGLMLEIIKK